VRLSGRPISRPSNRGVPYRPFRETNLSHRVNRRGEVTLSVGHERPICDGRAMSALAQKADSRAQSRDVRFGPITTFRTAEIHRAFSPITKGRRLSASRRSGSGPTVRVAQERRPCLGRARAWRRGDYPRPTPLLPAPNRQTRPSPSPLRSRYSNIHMPEGVSEA
jgi:hypothetical protein